MSYSSSNGHGNDDPGLGGFHRGPAPKEAPVVPMEADATSYSPFAALGLTPTATNSEIRPAFVRAMRHRHENVGV